MELDQKIVLVTGGASGIGKATAVAFAENGAKVVLLPEHITSCSGTLQAIRKKGGTGEIIKADLSRKDDIDRLIGKAIEEYGQLDVLFANAGIVKQSLVVDMSEA